MKAKTVKQNVVRITLAFLLILTVVFSGLLITQWKGNRVEEERPSQRAYIVQLNEAEKLYEEGKDAKAAGQLHKVMDSLRKQKPVAARDSFRNTIIIYVVSVIMVIGLFCYLYFLILRPFDELEDYAKEIAAGHLEKDFRYRRVNMFGSFTWAFDHMRTEILNARRQEQAAIENNKTVMATLSHDIKTPIASIRGYAEALVMHMDATPQRRERYANVIIRKCDEVTKITNDMFLHSLHDLDHLVIKKEPVAIHRILTDTLEDIGTGMDIHTIGEVAEADLSAADPGRIAQVIENIITNAHKYAPDSPIHIQTRIINADDTPEYRNLPAGNPKVYELSIRDFGSGIPDEDLPFIYEKFYRGKNAQNQSGAGLGLFIVHYIMEQLNGAVHIRNCENGLEVTLYFPII